jgi:serine/threonine protein kinase
MAAYARPADSATIQLARVRTPDRFSPLPRYTCESIAATTHRHIISIGIDHVLGRSVIVKQARPDTWASAEAAWLALLCEAAMLRFLARRQVRAPRYIDLFEADRSPCLVMTRVPGTTLEALHLAGQLSPDDAVRIITRLCAAVARLHALGYVHHDIKPANIMIQPDLTPVLIDWGCAEAIRPPGARRPNAGFTPAFVSPDQARGLARPTNDIFALGMTLDALVEWPSTALEGIVDRAIAQHEPRYRSAAALGRDLARLCMIDQLAGYVGLKAI